MAQAEHLPIYKVSYDLCLYIEQVVRGFSRYHKYTLGTDLLEVREEVEQLKAVLRLYQDVARLMDLSRSRTTRYSSARPMWTG